MSEAFESATLTDVPDDNAPDEDLLCSVCHLPMEYKGRGRKPKTHPECKTGRGAATPRTRVPTASVETALGTLGAMYDTVTAGLVMFGMTETAKQWVLSTTSLQTTNASVLRNDPSLVKAITKTAERGGKAMFIGSHIAAVLPVVIVARMEFAARKAAKPEKVRATMPQTDGADQGDGSAAGTFF